MSPRSQPPASTPVLTNYVSGPRSNRVLCEMSLDLNTHSFSEQTFGSWVGGCLFFCLLFFFFFKKPNKYFLHLLSAALLG